jgi:NNP family nitrate/nitrite transporter-like MFS transporter
MTPKALNHFPGKGMTNEASFRAYVPFLLYLTAIFYLNFLSRIILSPLMPTIESDLNIGHTEAGILFFCISLGYFPGLLGSGFVSSRLAHRWTIVLSSVTLGVLIGLSAGLYLPSAIATLTDMVSSKHWGKAIAVHELAPIVSFITAPLLAEGFMLWVSWRGVLAVVGVGAVVVGGVFTCFGRGGEFFGETPSPKNLRFLLAIPSFWIMVVFFSMGIAATLGVYTMLPLYLVAEEGLERTWANTLVGLSRIAAAAVILAAGWATDRIGPRRALGGIFLATGIATILLGLLHGVKILPVLFLQPPLASCFFPAGLAALSKIGPAQIRNVAVALVTPMAYVIAAGVIPAGIGILGDHGYFSLGFILLGILLIGTPTLLRYLKFHEDG